MKNLEDPTGPREDKTGLGDPQAFPREEAFACHPEKTVPNPREATADNLTGCYLPEEQAPNQPLRVPRIFEDGLPPRPKKEKSGRRESNPRQPAWEAGALPAELLPHKSLSSRCFNFPK